jgi:O-antigen/teichoic acid export membrane protein
LNENDSARLERLLKKSSINLMIVSTVLFLLINLNLNDFYQLINQEGYSSAIGVVIIVSFGKLFSMSMGCLNNIISNSKYYSYVFWFSVSSAVLAVILNFYFIQSYGIIGAAFATLAVLLFINTSKIILVHYLFKIHPYSLKTLGVVGSGALIYVITSLMPSIWNPWISISLRSLMILGLFCIPLFVFRWSTDMEEIIQKIKKRLV